MVSVRSAAVYTRISSDPDGTQLGVDRQEQDCRALAEELGWTVAEVYQDNDVSAFSTKPRPAYERMLADLREGHRDGVLCYHIDRLTRRNKDLDRFLERTHHDRARMEAQVRADRRAIESTPLRDDRIRDHAAARRRCHR